MDQSMEQRIERLEQRVGHYRWALVLLALGLCGVLRFAETKMVALGDAVRIATAADERVHDVLRTRLLEVVSASGQTGAIITANKSGGRLDVLNNAGQIAATVGADGDGGNLLVRSNADQLVAAVRTDEHGGRLSVWNNAGQAVASMASDETGGLLSVWNKSGDKVVQAYADDYGHGYIGVFDRKGKGQTLTPR
jgi:hypothetical protein